MTVDYKSYREQLAEAGGRHSAPSSDHHAAVEQLLDQLEAHEESERELLTDYRYAARFGPDPGVRFLMELILEDEDRHHRLTEAMVRDVKSSVLWLSAEPPLPSVGVNLEDNANVLSQTERFLGVEEESTAQLKALKKELKGLHDGLLELIVDGMEIDTHKHIDILKYIQKQLQGR